jgi:hypothetical protein
MENVLAVLCCQHLLTTFVDNSCVKISVKEGSFESVCTGSLAHVCTMTDSHNTPS